MALAVVLSLYLLMNSAEGVPPIVNHQGKVAVNGVNFDGLGLFKFALVNADGSVSYWSNDGSSDAGSEPLQHVEVPVVKGLFSVSLGDTALTNMESLSLKDVDRSQLRLRIWFNDGTRGFQKVAPDHALASVPYALIAAKADRVALSAVEVDPARPVIAWGHNGSGQTVSPSLDGVVAISCGEAHNVALLGSGDVVAWGRNTSGQTAVPSEAKNLVAIATGLDHTLGCRADGTIVAWGGNSGGKATVPGGISTARAVAAGANHSIALLGNGKLLAWGDNHWGQATIPPVLETNVVTAVASGYDHNLALTASGEVVAWGRRIDDEGGQMTVPAQASTGVVAIAAGAYHSLALKRDGSVVAWGWNGAGQCDVPGDLRDVVRVAGGYGFSMALKSDRTVVVWGETADQVTKVPMEATEVIAIACGARHALALRADSIPAQLARLDQDNVFSGRVGIARAPAANALEVAGNASKSFAGSWLANSDLRIKTEIASIEGALEKLDQVRLVDFRYTGDYLAMHPEIEDRRYPNVIAQEFAGLFPDDVKGSGQYLPDGSEILQVDTYPLIIYSAASIQELHRENRSLQNKINEQEKRLRKLEELLKDS